MVTGAAVALLLLAVLSRGFAATRAVISAAIEWQVAPLNPLDPRQIHYDPRGDLVVGHVVPIAMALCWFVSNVVEALIGAFFVRRFAGRVVTLGTVRDVIVFSFAALLAPLVSSFLDAGFGYQYEWSNSAGGCVQKQ